MQLVCMWARECGQGYGRVAGKQVKSGCAHIIRAINDSIHHYIYGRCEVQKALLCSEMWRL